MSDFHDAIAVYFEEQATWRDEKAAEHPNDVRNKRSADGLRELANYVRRLPSNDERIIELGTIGFDDGAFSLPSNDSASYAVSRFRFDDLEDCARFLTKLVPLLRADAIRRARFAGELEMSD